MVQKNLKFNKLFFIKLLLIPVSLVLILILLIIAFTYEDVFGIELSPLIQLLLIIFLIAGISILSFSIVLSVKEYKTRFVHKQYFHSVRSRLTIKEIFENENRKKIIKAILEGPGIHHNELLRKGNLQKGQLQWHLDVLLKYDIIKKEKFGQYTVYFPIFKNIETLENFGYGIAKSETSIKIFKLIQKNPGITSSEISQKINLARNTVKYHIDKLSESNLIILRKVGRKIELFPKVNS